LCGVGGGGENEKRGRKIPAKENNGNVRPPLGTQKGKTELKFIDSDKTRTKGREGQGELDQRIDVEEICALKSPYGPDAGNRRSLLRAGQRRKKKKGGGYFFSEGRLCPQEKKKKEEKAIGEDYESKREKNQSRLWTTVDAEEGGEAQ